MYTRNTAKNRAKTSSKVSSFWGSPHFDSSLFSNIDFIFVHSGYISHAFYSRVISSLRSYPHVSLHYLHDTNPFRSLKDIAAAIDGETF